MADDQQFCLRWNNHQSTLIQNFDTLLESGTLVDCTLAAEGKYLKAHKVVLSACSPYFEGLLSEHYDKHPVFILKDVKFKELKAMMDYMYRGEVNISQDQLTALLKAAESLQIKGLSDSKTGGTGATTGKAEHTRSAKTASSTAASTAASVDIPHASSGLTIEKNKVPRTSHQQQSVGDLPEDSASPHPRGLSSREGSQSPTRKRKRIRRRSNDDTNTSMENHEASNSSDLNASAPTLGVAPVVEDKSHAESADPIGRSALMQQLTKSTDDMLQMPIEKPEPNEEMIQPKSEYVDDAESVEDLTNLDDDMNDLNEMEQDNSRAGPSHDPSQHPGLATWHMAGDRGNASVVGAAGGPTGGQDDVFLAAHDAAQAQRDSQDLHWAKYNQGSSQPPAKRHRRSASSIEKGHMCESCGKLYSQKTVLRRHLNYECGKRPRFQCPHCNYRTKHRSNVYQHIKTRHPNREIYVVDLGRPGGILPCLTAGYRGLAFPEPHSWSGPGYQPPRARSFVGCERCGAVFRIQKELNYHRRHNCGRVHRCTVCQTVYKSLQTAKVHFKRRHPELMIVSEPNAIKHEPAVDSAR